jgi:anti-sigma factor RsiW
VIEQNGRIHNQVAELLSAYIDDEVTTEERVLIESHLATCTSCTHDMAALRQTVSLVGQLPQVPAPRPFTLRESDVRPARPARRAWWRLPWAQGLAAATAMLVCVVVVAGVYLLGQGGMVGAPAAPAPVAMQQAAPAAEAPAEELSEEKAVAAEAETVVETVIKEAEKVAEPAAAPPPAPEKATDEVGLSQEDVPAEAVQSESEVAVAEEGEAPMDALSDRAAADTALTPTVLPAPASEAMPAAPAPTPSLQATLTLTPTLLEVEDLMLVIESGVISASGRLPLPEGRKLRAELWQDGQPIEWAEPESQVLVIEVNGQFTLKLQALAGIEDFDLPAVELVQYEIRIHPVDPPAPVEIRIPFDAHGPLTPPPTSSP